MKKVQKPYFSVIICSYNRAEILKKCIESVIAQTLPKSKYEVIIMDDGSSDNTINTIKEFQKKYEKPEIRFYSSKNKGLAHSRNNAIKKSRGEYLAYIDDDAIADKFWLEKALGTFKRIKPQPLAVTGPIFTYYNKEKPYWFKDKYEEDLKGIFSRFLKKGEAFSGPNMILNKGLVIENGGFAEDVDMKADLLMVGEETKLYEKIFQKHPEKKLLYYSTDIKVYHLVHPYKMKISYRLKRWFASGQSYFLRNRKISFFKKTFLALKVLSYFLISFIFIFISLFQYRFFQNWIVERIGPIMFVFGFFTSLLHIPINMISKQRS